MNCILILLVALVQFEAVSFCPIICTCKSITSLKMHVDCSNANIAHVEYRNTNRERDNEINILEIDLLPQNTTVLNLSGNILQDGFESFEALTSLQFLEKLDLGYNVLTSFGGNKNLNNWKHLEVLNLKGNIIELIEPQFFSGLRSLKRLYLGRNPIFNVEGKFFKDLINLEFLDLSFTLLNCDCEIQWLWRRLRKTNLTLGPNTRCYFPLKLRGIGFNDVKKRDLVCQENSFVPEIFELSPSETQAVFKGDSLSLSCRVMLQPGFSVIWIHNNLPVPEIIGKYLQSIEQRNQSTIHYLVLHNMTKHDQGTWRCILESQQFWFAKHMNLMVLANHPSATNDDNQSECPSVTSDRINDKGVYAWPITNSNQSISLPCQNGPSNKTASRTCNINGKWSTENLEDCEYTSKTVLYLKQTYINKNNQILWLQFLNWTELYFKNETQPSPVDIYFIIKVVIQFEDSVELEVLNNIIGLPQSVLHKAELNYGAIEQLRSFVSSNISPTKLHTSQDSNSVSTKTIAACSLYLIHFSEYEYLYKIGSHDVEGLICKTVYLNEGQLRYDQLITSSKSVLSFPSSFLKDNQVQSEADPELLPELRVESLSVLWMKASALFIPQNNENGSNIWISQSQVFGLRKVSKFLASVNKRSVRGNETLENSTRSKDETKADLQTFKFVELEFEILYETDTIKVGIWNETWQSWQGVPNDVCFESRRWGKGPFVVSFKCIPSLFRVQIFPQNYSKFVFLSIVQLDSELSALLAPRKPVPIWPWMYVTSGLLTSCFAALFIAYSCFKGWIMSRKLRHGLLNVWFLLCLLNLLFILGIDKVLYHYLCLAVSIALHYAALASLLWIFLVVRTLQRKFSKLVYPTVYPPDETPSPVPGHGPLLGMYFLAYGVPVIAVAFAVALRFEDYSRNKFCCFLPIGEVFYGALLIPACFIILMITVLLLRFMCLTKVQTSHDPDTNQTTGDDSRQFLMSPQRQQTSDNISCQTSVLDISQTSYSRQLGLIVTTFMLSLSCVAIASVYVWNRNFLESLLPWSSELIGCVYSAFILILCCVLIFGYIVCSSFMNQCIKPPQIPANPQNGVTRNIVTSIASGTNHPAPSMTHSLPPPIKREVMYTSISGVSLPNEPQSNGRSGAISPTHSDPVNNHQDATGFNPDAQRFLRSVAKKYHLKQRMLKDKEEGGLEIDEEYEIVELTDIQSEVIFEENEEELQALSPHGSSNADYVNVAQLQMSTKIS